MSRTPPGCFTNVQVGYHYFTLSQAELPTMQSVLPVGIPVDHLKLGYPLVTPFGSNEDELKHIALDSATRMGYAILHGEQLVHDETEVSGIQRIASVVNHTYRSILKPAITVIRRGVHKHTEEFLQQCSKVCSQEMEQTAKHHKEALKGLGELLNKLLVHTHARQKPEDPIELSPVRTESSLAEWATPQHQGCCNIIEAFSLIRSLPDTMVSRGFTQCQTIKEVLFVDGRFAVTLDAAMEMEEVLI